MNKRIVIVDELSTSLSKFVGVGLGEDIFTVSNLVTGDPKREADILSAGPGDGILAIGSSAFELVKKHHHLGIRSENYFDCSLLRRLGMDGGGYVKVLHENDPLDEETIKFFMSEEFCKTRTFPNFTYEVVKEYERSLPFLDYFMSLPLKTLIGFDYETSGMAMNKNFKITGAAFALAYPGSMSAVFFSFTEIEATSTPEQFQDFKERFKKVLVKHHKDIWVYNMAFESQVTWREFGVELDFCDASVFNFEDGLHTKNYSLKWTAQRLLGGGDKYHLKGMIEGDGLQPWDTDFDMLEDAFSRLYWVYKYEKGKKKPVGKVFKCSEYDWELQPEWKEINQLYPGYEEEFRRLVNENFGNPFLNMPADILGKYCCLDSFYTVLIAMENLPRYSPLCHETFLNNQRVYSALERGGLYIDDPYRKKYENYCHKMCLWGIAYVATYRCYKKIQEHEPKAKKLERYPEFAAILLKRNEFCNGNVELITKNLLAQNVDQTQCYDTGLNEGELVLKYGNKFASGFVKIVKEAMIETKFKGVIDETVARKKKLISYVSEKLYDFLGMGKINLGAKHTELEKLLFYKRAYSSLMSVWSQVKDINHIPDYIYWDKKKVDVYTAARSIMEGYYRCSSPIINAELEQEFIQNEFRLETAFLATIARDVNKLDGEKRYYKNLGLNTPSEAMDHFSKYCSVFYSNLGNKTGICLWPTEIPKAYPIEVFQLFNQLYLNPDHDYMTETWGDWKGYDKQADFFKDYVQSEEELMSQPWSESDLDLNPFTRMRKLLLNILLYKKYEKLRSTYICDTGLFNTGSKYVIDTPRLMPLRDADPEEPGAVKKTFLRYRVMQLETKRCSSGFHTIPSHEDMKGCVTCPVFDTPESRTGKTATLLSYFDINKTSVA